MLDQLARTITHLVRNTPRFEPASLNDPLALKTGWHPLKPGGTNFRTRKLVAVSSGRMAFRPTLASWLFVIVFIGVGPVGAGLLYAQHPVPLHMVKPGVWILLAGGLVFALFGLYFAFNNLLPLSFDKQAGVFRRGFGSTAGGSPVQSSENVVNLDDVHALQIISELCDGTNKRTFISYELNLVLRDGRRVHLIDHGRQDRLKADAAMLAGFLGKPVWDAT